MSNARYDAVPGDASTTPSDSSDTRQATASSGFFDRKSVGFRSARGPILIAIMLGTALVAMDQAIIATAIPSITSDLGGFTQAPWLFSVYMLAQAILTPVYGKLADLVGRKPIMLLGIALFLGGSILGGAAWSMPVLIAARAIQGLGAGAVQPMAMTIAGDIYTVAERAAVTGYLSSVWGISAVLGPTLGGVFSEYITWRWIFFVNIPLCALAGWMLVRSFHESVERTRHRIDITGATLVAGGATLVILTILEGGEAWPWLSAAGIAVPVIGVVMLIAFVIVELHVAEPVLPLWVFSRRMLLTTSLTALTVGAIVLGLATYIPTYVQGSLGMGALVAGLCLAPVSIGWPISSAQAGRIYLRFGFKVTSILGALIVLAAMLGMITVFTAHTSVWVVPVLCFVLGCGMGLCASPTVIAAQASVGWSQRGVVTGNNMFSRSIGSALGVAVFGAVVNGILGSAAAEHTPVELATAIHGLVITIGIVALGLLLAVVCMPGGRDTSQVTD